MLHLSALGEGFAVFSTAELPMVKTGQGLVLRAITGSRPLLELHLAEESASGPLFFFTVRWTLQWLRICVDVCASGGLFWLGAWMCCSGACCSKTSCAWMQCCVPLLPWGLLVFSCSWGCASFSGWGFIGFSILFCFLELSGSLCISKCEEVILFIDKSFVTEGILGDLGCKLMGFFRWRRMGMLGWGLLGISVWEDKLEEGSSYKWDGRQSQFNFITYIQHNYGGGRAWASSLLEAELLLFCSSRNNSCYLQPFIWALVSK